MQKSKRKKKHMFLLRFGSSFELEMRKKYRFSKWKTACYKTFATKFGEIIILPEFFIKIAPSVIKLKQSVSSAHIYLTFAMFFSSSVNAARLPLHEFSAGS